MTVAKGNSDATHRLVDLSVHEVGMVTRPANKREFLVVKADTNMRGQLLKTSKNPAEQIVAAVADLQKIDATTEAGLKELREKNAALSVLLKEEPEVAPTTASTASAVPAPAEPANVAKAATPSLDHLLVTKADSAQPDIKQVSAALSALTTIVNKMAAVAPATASNAADTEAAAETQDDPWAEFARKKVE